MLEKEGTWGRHCALQLGSAAPGLAPFLRRDDGTVEGKGMTYCTREGEFEKKYYAGTVSR
jgi:hypothetical protein